MGCYIGVPVIVFGIYLTKHPQHGDRFQIQIRNTGRGDDPLKVFGIYLARHLNSGVRFSRYKFEYCSWRKIFILKC